MDSLIKGIQEFAPLVARTLGGPLAGTAVEWLAGKLGTAATAEAVTDAISGMKPEDKIALKKLDVEFQEHMADNGLKLELAEQQADTAAQGNVSDRWKSDMMSDSKLSKICRPIVLLYWTGAISLMALLSHWLQIEPVWVDLIKYSYVTVLGAYFIGRSVQHVTRMFKEPPQ